MEHHLDDIGMREHPVVVGDIGIPEDDLFDVMLEKDLHNIVAREGLLNHCDLRVAHITKPSCCAPGNRRVCCHGGNPKSCPYSVPKSTFQTPPYLEDVLIAPLLHQALAAIHYD